MLHVRLAMANLQNANNPPALSGGYRLLGRYSTQIATTATTIVAARTTSAGHIASLRWVPATNTDALMYIRHVTARFVLTTAYTTAQETGIDLIVARAYSVVDTGGTAIDVGGTITGSGKRYTAQPASQLANLQIHGTGALTAGTRTLDASPVSVLSAWSAVIGDTVPLVTSGGGGAPGILWDSRGTNDHLVLATGEGLVFRNLILQGAVGVGRWYFGIGWDEGVPNGAASL